MLFTSLCHLNPSSRARELPRSLPFAGLRHACQPATLEDPLRAVPSSRSLSLVLCALSCSRCLAVSCHALSLSRLDKSARPRSSTWTYFATGEQFAMSLYGIGSLR
jgi:hypothetical protein